MVTFRTVPPFILRPMQILRTVAFLSIALFSIVSPSQQLQGTAAQASATWASLDQTLDNLQTLNQTSEQSRREPDVL